LENGDILETTENTKGLGRFEYTALLYKGTEILRRGGGVKRKLLFDPYLDHPGGDG
jgi:hypothetical protein